MNEKTLTTKILKELRAHGAYAVKTHGGMYQTAGLPDIAGCYLGMFFGLEVKVPGREKTVTKIQSATLAQIRAAGGMALVITTVERALDVLDSIASALDEYNGTD